MTSGDFTGRHLFRDAKGELQCVIYAEGRMVADVLPSEADHSRKPGFYDTSNKLVPDPFFSEKDDDATEPDRARPRE